MTRILLTGAGFSRNWGGWLADEVHEYLVGCPELDADARAALWRARQNGGGYETALAEAADPARRRMYEDAIVGMFNGMNASFRKRSFEFNTDPTAGVGNFLSKFDAIFTLNHDLLLERHYFESDVRQYYSRQWHAVRSPGIRALSEPGPGQKQFEVLCEPSEPGGSLPPRVQPYIKLHGSSNWRTRNGGRLLVVGGNKADSIDADQLLSWSWQQFRQSMARVDARLMVIGYSFRDPHVNRALLEAFVNKPGLFIIDPHGVDVLDTRDKRAAISIRPELFDLHASIIGGSRRGLAETFGVDAVERTKLMRFFNT